MVEVKGKGKLYLKGQPEKVASIRVFCQFRRPLEVCGKLRIEEVKLNLNFI